MAEPDAYIERYVAFMDVLGFSQLVSDADRDAEKREVISGIIRTLRETFREVPTSAGFRFTQFSDCIVLSADRSRDGLLAVFTGCVDLTARLMADGVLLRGGIAVGNVLHTDNALFGKGLLAAYRNDASGSPPRIALCHSTEADAEEFGLSALVRRDPMDLTTMLHTLWEIENFSQVDGGSDEPEIRGYNAFIHITTNAIDMELPPTVRAKWRWLRVYWNESLKYRDTPFSLMP